MANWHEIKAGNAMSAGTYILDILMITPPGI